MCVVVNDERVVLGVVKEEAMIENPNAAVEQIMESGPATIRPSWSLEETTEYLREHKTDHILVTTSDGRLVGFFDQQGAERQRSRVATKRGS